MILVTLLSMTPARESPTRMHAPSRPLDVTTAFAVPNPNASSQNASVFSGLVALQVALPSRSLSLLWTGSFNFEPTLSAVDGDQLKRTLNICQRHSSVQRQNFCRFCNKALTFSSSWNYAILIFVCTDLPHVIHRDLQLANIRLNKKFNEH